MKLTRQIIYILFALQLSSVASGQHYDHFYYETLIAQAETADDWENLLDLGIERVSFSDTAARVLIRKYGDFAKETEHWQAHVSALGFLTENMVHVGQGDLAIQTLDAIAKDIPDDARDREAALAQLDLEYYFAYEWTDQAALSINKLNSALQYFESINDSSSVSFYYNNLAFVTEVYSGAEAAIVAGKNSLRWANDSDLICKGCFSVAGYCLLAHQLDSAEHYYRKGKKNMPSAQSISLEVQRLMTAQQIASYRKNHARVIAYADTGLVVIGDLNDSDLNSMLLAKSRALKSLGEIDEAKKLGLQVLKICQKNDFANIAKATSRFLQKLALETNDQSLLSFITPVYNQIVDSLFSYEKGIEQADQLRELVLEERLKYEALQAEEKLEDKREARQKLIFLSIALFVLLLGTVGLVNFALKLQRSRKKLKTLLKESHQKSKELKESALVLKEKNIEIEEFSEKIKHRNHEIIQSLTYARRVQSAVMLDEREFRTIFKRSMLIYRPKDIVSGDFFWCAKMEGKKMMAVIDCTGHGPPGAMVSVLIQNILNEIVMVKGHTNPGEILDLLNEAVFARMNKGEHTMRDGCDIGLCVWDREQKVLSFAGAMLSLYHFHNSGMQQIHATRKSIGTKMPDVPFATFSFPVQPNDTLYMFSDGFPDQFGMRTGKKLKRKNLLQLISEVKDDSMASQHEILDDYFENWKGSREQTDDVTLVGFRVGTPA